MQSLTNWFSTLPEEACVFTLSTGNGRKLEQILKIVTSKGIEHGWSPKANEKNEVFQAIDHDDVADQIQGVLEDTGYGFEFEKARVYCYTVEGKHVKNKLLRKSLAEANKDNSVSAIQSLAQCNIAMSNEVRRTLSVVTDNNARLLEQVVELTESFVSAKREQIIAENERMAYELVLENKEAEEDNEARETGFAVLGQIAEALQGQFGKKFSIGDLKEHLKANPADVDAFMEDPEIIDIVMSKMGLND